MPKIEPFEQYSDEYDRWFEINRDLCAARQTLIPEKPTDTVLDGSGKGPFVVIKGEAASAGGCRHVTGSTGFSRMKYWPTI